MKKAKDLGVSTETIGKSLETLYGGKRVTTFNKLGKEYPIILQQYLSDRRNKEGISKIFVRSDTTGKLISLELLWGENVGFIYGNLIILVFIRHCLKNKQR